MEKGEVEGPEQSLGAPTAAIAVPRRSPTRQRGGRNEIAAVVGRKNHVTVGFRSLAEFLWV